MRVWPMLATLLVAAAVCGPARAMESPPVNSPRATVSLVTDTDAYAPGKPFQAGLRFRLAPGWHTYWQNPGDAGSAPELSLTLPPGATAGAIAWPVPQRLAEGPVTTYAYTGALLLPIPIAPAAAQQRPADPLVIQAHAAWLVCANICVPEQGSFRLTLPPGTPAPSAQAGLFAAARRQIPRPSPWVAHIAPDGTLSVSGDALTPARVQDAWFFPSVAGAIEPAAPQTLSLHDGSLTLALKPAPDFHPQAGLPGVLTVRAPDGQESYLQLEATPGTPPVATAPAPLAPGLSLLRILALAWLGGVILNLMPCVFPVLAMKALSLVQLSGRARAEIRLHAASYTAGILVAFGGLGGLLLALRAAGSAAGWGFQFQSPVFVAAVAWLLFGVGLNLSGVFQVGGTLVGAGQGLASRTGHIGSFFTGLLAVLVATPCTAPFMGAAIAAALAASAPVTVAVFLAMGLGLAAPYLLLALLPGSARVFPAPGRWMEVLKQGLAFPMYAAAAWLLWVISQEAGPAGVLGTAAGLVLLGFAAWSIGATQAAGGQGRRLGQAAAIAACLAALAVLPGIAAAPPPPVGANARTGVEPFSLARLDILRAQGRPVFVDMTAAWCVTCLVNERVALSPEPVRKAFAERHVAYLKGDWTRQDPDITAFLRQYGRDGVPLYVLYPAGPQAPTVLPQILTQSEVLDELRHIPPADLTDRL